MATTKKTKTNAKSKIVTTIGQRNELLISKKVTSLLNTYKNRQIAALKKKIIIIDGTCGGIVLDDLMKSFNALAAKLKKFPNELAGIPAIDKYQAIFTSNLKKFRSKNSKIINSNQLILKEIAVLENSNFINNVANLAIKNFSKQKISSASAIKATAVEALAKAYVNKQMKAK